MNTERIAAIIPAYNEERTIARIVRVMQRANIADDIVVVSDGSTDATAARARAAGARVVELPRNRGKGEALRAGIEETTASILFFCDADLVGLRAHHIHAMIEPVRSGAAVMCVGLRDRWGIPSAVVQLDHLMAIGGERAVRREIFEALEQEEYHGFGVEIALNDYCYERHLPVCFVEMRGVTHVVKEVKWGGMRGLLHRIPWLWQMVRMRILCFFPHRKKWHKHL